MSEYKTLSRCLASANEGTLTFFCLGCDIPHPVNVGGNPGKPQWGFNGDLEAPTFTPSVLVSWEQHGKKQTCHSFITAGRIYYLGDCTHHLAGKSIDLPDWQIHWDAW